MAFSVSHWSGRLGNNIQQVANCILAAEKHKTDFTQTLDHDIISKFTVNFGSDNIKQSGRFYAWEALVHCEHGCYEGCLLYTSPSQRDGLLSRMPSSA